MEVAVELVISDAVKKKIWDKDNRRISTEDVQQAWGHFLAADYRFAAFDTRPEHDSWPPTEWILVRLNRQVIKLVFLVDDADDDAAYLKTAVYVDQKTIKAYQTEGGIIYG